MNFNIPDIKKPALDINEWKNPSFEPVDLLKLKYKTVNRLIMVGNGFDLAHNLKSGFHHFIYDYIKSILESSVKSVSHTDQLISIHTSNYNSDKYWIIDDLTEENCIDRLNKLSKIPNIILRKNSQLFDRIITDIKSKCWVDIEVLYFDLLAKAVEKKDSAQIRRLNKDIDFIREKLIVYLEKQTNNTSIELSSNLLNQFRAPIKKQEALLNTIEDDMTPNQYYFLNFNYTNILQSYAENMPEKNWLINYIHGSLDSNHSNGQKPIFGFGDELDKKYKTFEDQRDDEVFKHIKSFKYLESNNYRNLMEFVGSDPFQIHIYGHSCGVSDRTLLNSIFEHENCISIKIYYYQNGENNDYTSKNYSISRHFTNKIQLRNKLVNYKYSSPMYQSVCIN